ncbi:hypothetical protein VFPBJ_03785 [Purpureocillium lilacinum]|uniref:Uncharacterized protein n=1 Tax=Purpureocillium lilacinum TaxID=33203 RepID=A0A179H4Q2_PURLI|nr:hypothetical protein VFPBJ_03785 [Purpureocillium lilacinum]
MCYITSLLYTVCLHSSAATRNDFCVKGKCKPRKQRTELKPGWCPQCKASLSGGQLFAARPGDLAAPSTIWRYWLWVSRQQPAPSLAGPVKEHMIADVDRAEINHATSAAADREWAARMMGKIRGGGAEAVKVRKKEWVNDGKEKKLREAVEQAQYVTMRWAQGLVLV